jgi:HTH-type transcriptional regulator, sugar sensing transcriptional regulator
MDTHVLEQMGLSGSEIKVYFALLELETSTVGPIVERSGVQDSKIYSILEKLLEKGLASFVVKNNVKHFRAADPGNLVKLIGEKEELLRRQKEELEKTIIPEIEKRRKLTEEKQEATVYEGYEGFRSALYTMLDIVGDGGEYLVFMLGKDLEDERTVRFFISFHRHRQERRIKVRLLSNERFRKLIEEKHKHAGMDIRFTEQEIPIGTFIYPGHAATIVWGEKPAAFVIKSKKNYEYQREFFEDVWKKSSK